MGAPQSTDLHSDTNGVPTSAVFADGGDTTPRWLLWTRIANGGHTAFGATTDAAITNPATNGTLIGFIRGLLTKAATIAEGFKAEDTAHVSADVGVMPLAVRKDTAAASSGTTGDYEPLQTDSLGRLRTVAKRDSTDALSIATNAHTAADDLVVKASAGTLHSIVGTVLSGEDGFIMVIDAASQPANGAVAVEAIYTVGAATANVPVNIPLPGHACTTGIVIVWSTTSATLTAGGAKLLLTAYYE